MKLVTPQQMSSIEQACQQSGITNRQLMEQAGMAIAGWIMQNCRLEANNCVVMLIGPGNNGGVGLVAARCLSDKGCRIDMIMPVISETNRDLLQEAVAAGAELVDMDAGQDSKAEQAAVIIDAFFGTGKNRPVQGAYRAVLEKVGLLKQQRYHPLCIAIDIPSGVDGNSGRVIRWFSGLIIPWPWDMPKPVCIIQWRLLATAAKYWCWILVSQRN
jgi:NAD(P)H-hydrate epimerase